MSDFSLLDVRRSVVVVVDLQGKLVDMTYASASVVAATSRLIRVADLFGVPVVLTEQYPDGLGPTHPEIRARFDALGGAKRYVSKVAFGCCGEPAFESALAEVLPGVPVSERQLVVAGIETHVCVLQTVVELLRAGSQAHVCWDCVSGRGREHRAWALDRMRQAGAVITNHESVGFEWARTKDHEAFRGLNRLFREGQIAWSEP